MNFRKEHGITMSSSIYIDHATDRLYVARINDSKVLVKVGTDLSWQTPPGYNVKHFGDGWAVFTQ